MSSERQDLLPYVVDYHRHGLSCVPFAPRSREPEPDFRWRKYQNTQVSLAEVRALFRGKNNANANLAIICGKASDNLFVPEIDNASAFADFGRLLNGLGIDTWTMQRDHFVDGDPHAGGGHYYLKAPVPVKGCLVKGIDVRGQGQVVIAPPSIHPTGALYRFPNRPPIIFRLPALTTIPMLQLEPAVGQNNGPRISRLAWRLLKGDPETLKRYDTRSPADFALMASLIRTGCSYDQILKLMSTYPGSGRFGEMNRDNPDEAKYYFNLTFKNALNFVTTHTNAATRTAQTLLGWAGSRPWPGRTGSTDKAVFVAHLRIVLRCGQDPHGASVRELGELAGVSWKTAANANWRLVGSGLLAMATEGTPSLSTRWKLIPPPGVNVSQVSSIHTPSRSGG